MSHTVLDRFCGHVNSIYNENKDNGCINQFETLLERFAGDSEVVVEDHGDFFK